MFMILKHATKPGSDAQNIVRTHETSDAGGSENWRQLRLQPDPKGQSDGVFKLAKIYAHAALQGRP